MDIYATENIYYVYAYLRSGGSATAPAGTPYYIGKGSNGRAFANHGSLNLPPHKGNIAFLETGLSENKAFEIEKFLIAYYGRKDLGTGILLNKTHGGEGVSGIVVSEETRAKMSAAQIGRTHSEESKAKMSVAMSGKTHSEKTKAKLSAAHSGKTLSDEHKSKLSAVLMGKNNPWYGKHHSEESKAKLSAVNSGKTLSDETKAKISAFWKNQPLVTCPYCGKQGKGGAMKQWHFDNCNHRIEPE